MNIDCNPSSRLGLYRGLCQLARLFLAFGMLLLALSAQAEWGKPAYPVIFIHGINSNADDTWGDFRKAAVANGWTDGGSPRWDGSASAVTGVTAGDFYTLKFSSDHDLDFFAQGFELSAIITAVRHRNNLATKVILVAHSMGGLAARAYIQNQAKSKDGLNVAAFGNDVQKVITVGTPNQGSMFAEYATELCGKSTSNFTLCNSNLPWIGPDLHPDSVAWLSLAPWSNDLYHLNNAASLLPQSGVQQFVSIVVTWERGNINGNTLTQVSPTLVYGDGGDGIVTETSQDLSKVVSFADPNMHQRDDHMVFSADPGLKCGNINSYVAEVHTCETKKAKMWGMILSHILTPVNLTVSTGASSVSQTTPPQVTVQGEVSFLAPLTKAYFQYGTTASSLNPTVAPTRPITAALSGTTQLSANLPTTLQPGTTYYYQLVAETGGGIASGGQTAVGQVHQVTIPPAVGTSLLPAPTSLSPASGAATQPLTPTLTWNTVTGATSYRIMVAQDATALPIDPTDGNCDRCLVDFVPGPANPTSYTPPAGLLTSGTTYYWQVHARSPDNFGAWTAASSFTTQSLTPATLLPAPTQTAPADGDTGQTTMPTLSWTPITGATSYRIMIAPTAAALTTDPTSADCLACVTNAVVPGAQGTAYVPYAGLLAVGSTYSWSVKARSPGGYGAWSTVRSFTPTAQAQVVTEFSAGMYYDGFHFAGGITAGPDGNLWFTTGGYLIGRITPSGVVTKFSTGSNSLATISSITAGPDGNLWFTEFGAYRDVNRIGRITPTGVVTGFSAGIDQYSSTGPVSITAGPDGNLWFIEPDVNQIGRITTTGVITKFGAGISANANLKAITAGPDGNLWFTEGYGNQIGRITTRGVVTEFSAGVTFGAELGGITAGPDGNLWFTVHNYSYGNYDYGDLIGRITTAGVVTEFSVGISQDAHFIMSITAGADGNLWFTDHRLIDPNTYGNTIWRITPTGALTEFIAEMSQIGTDPMSITAGPDGNLWFTESLSDRIGRITIGGGSSNSSETLNVVAGWNLVGNGSSGSLDVATAFGTTSNVLTVWKWIANGAKWAFYAPSLVGQALTDYATTKGYDVLTTVSGGEGFWVNAKTAFTAQLPAGTAITSASYQTGLATGWNLIAVGDSPTPRTFDNAINVTTLWAWDALKTNWYFYAPSLDAQGGAALSNYITSKSYLDFGTMTLDPTMGFWVNRP